MNEQRFAEEKVAEAMTIATVEPAAEPANEVRASRGQETKRPGEMTPFWRGASPVIKGAIIIGVLLAPATFGYEALQVFRIRREATISRDRMDEDFRAFAKLGMTIGEPQYSPKLTEGSQNGAKTFYQIYSSVMTLHSDAVNQLNLDDIFGRSRYAAIRNRRDPLSKNKVEMAWSEAYLVRRQIPAVPSRVRQSALAALKTDLDTMHFVATEQPLFYYSAVGVKSGSAIPAHQTYDLVEVLCYAAVAEYKEGRTEEAAGHLLDAALITNNLSRSNSLELLESSHTLTYEIATRCWGLATDNIDNRPFCESMSAVVEKLPNVPSAYALLCQKMPPILMACDSLTNDPRGFSTTALLRPETDRSPIFNDRNVAQLFASDIVHEWRLTFEQMAKHSDDSEKLKSDIAKLRLKPIGADMRTMRTPFGELMRACDVSRSNTTSLRLLKNGLQLLPYRNNHGEFPKQLRDLNGGAVTSNDEDFADPFGNGDLVYRRTNRGFMLYSVGPNGVDDGGSGDKEVVGPAEMYGPDYVIHYP